jgi:hypothetical protein
MNSEGEEQGENKFVSFPARMVWFWNKCALDFVSVAENIPGNTVLELIEHG